MPMKRTLCHAVTIAAFHIQLWQEGKDNFKVIYSKQVKANLTYERAALEYGACIMHALACEGILDNRLPGER